jgi:molecular chaperone GrpE
VNRKSPQSFELSIDDSVLAAALAAVDARQRKPTSLAPTELPDVELATDLGEEMTGDVVLGDVDLPTGEAPLTDMSGMEALETELAAVQRELAALRGELARAREEARGERERAEREAEERKKALAQAARQSERAQKIDVALQISRQGRDQAEQQLLEARDQIGRQQADLDRAQERRRREVEEAKRNASRQGLEELVPVLDNLEMALLHAAESDPLASGLRMVVEQFRRGVERLGAERVPARPGSPFQPERHEAVQQQHGEQAAGTIAAELRSGYMLHGRLFRAARVAVSMGPAPAPQAEPETVEVEERSAAAEPQSDPAA